MDVQALLSLVAVSVITAGSEQTSSRPTAAVETQTVSSSTQATSPCSNCACLPSPTASATHLQLGLLKVRWRGCQGHVELVHPQHQPPLPVCHDSNVSTVLENVCQERRGCGGAPRWHDGTKAETGYRLQETGIVQEKNCVILRVQCSDEAAEEDVKGQLWTYKVLTALLFFVLVLLLMIRFTKPTVRALQKRLSDRRQNRWIGPTQSHSVSYHREKAAVKNSDREKRLSYPALERLTVIDSREPSSNRNSDCNY